MGTREDKVRVHGSCAGEVATLVTASAECLARSLHILRWRHRAEDEHREISCQWQVANKLRSVFVEWVVNQNVFWISKPAPLLIRWLTLQILHAPQTPPVADTKCLNSPQANCYNVRNRIDRLSLQISVESCNAALCPFKMHAL